MIAEIMPVVQNINYTQKHLRRWMQPSRRSVGLHFLPASGQVVYQPLGENGVKTGSGLKHWDHRSVWPM
jgi:coniferyl-aldehyde dehydrogenase